MDSTETQTVVRLSGPAEMVSTVPRLVGFQPEESVVVVSLRGPRKRMGVTMRIDLPVTEHHELLAEQFAERCAADGATAALVVIYTDELGELPRSDLAERFRTALSARGIALMDALLVREGRWWSYHCRDASCCPPDGQEIPAVPTGGAALYAAEAAVRGKGLLRDRAELEASVRPPGQPRRTSLEQLLTSVAAYLWAECRRDGSRVVADRIAGELKATFECWLSGDREISDEQALRMVLGLADIPTRDLVLGWYVEPRQFEDLAALLTALCRRAPEGVGTPVCTVLAWWAYQAGDGALANVALDRALEEQPTYNLARLLRSVVDAGFPPEQLRDAFRPGSGRFPRVPGQRRRASARSGKASRRRRKR